MEGNDWEVKLPSGSELKSSKMYQHFNSVNRNSSQQKNDFITWWINKNRDIKNTNSSKMNIVKLNLLPEDQHREKLQRVELSSVQSTSWRYLHLDEQQSGVWLVYRFSSQLFSQHAPVISSSLLLKFPVCIFQELWTTQSLRNNATLVELTSSTCEIHWLHNQRVALSKVLVVECISTVLWSDSKYSKSSLATIDKQSQKYKNTCCSVDSVRKLVDWWRYFQSFLQNWFLTLDLNVFGPSDKSTKITFWLNVLTWNNSQY